MATSRITGVNEDCRNDADSAFLGVPGKYGTARDFTALQNWEADNDRNMTTDDKSLVLECYDDVASWDDLLGFTAGAESDATRFRTIRAAPGEGHDGTSNNGVYFKSTNTATMFSIQESRTSLQDLLLTYNGSNASNVFCYETINLGTDQSIIGCIVFDCLNSGAGGTFGIRLFRRTGAAAINCLVDNTDLHNYAVDGFGGTVRCYNCTSIDAGDDGFNTNNDAILKNCLSHGSTNKDFDSAGSPAADSTHNAAEDATAISDAEGASGSDCRDSQTFTFVGDPDFHLDPGDGGALGFGTDLSGDADFSFDDDIDLETITTWSIGFDSHLPVVVVAGPPGALAGVA